MTAHRGIGAYVAGVAAGTPWSERETQSPDDAAEEKVLLGLRTVEGAALGDLALLGRRVGEGPLAGLIADGFLAVDSGRVRATRTGRPVLDGVLKALLV